jgi:hypothetical protein
MVCEEVVRRVHNIGHISCPFAPWAMTLSAIMARQIIQPRFVVGLPVDWTGWAGLVKYRVTVPYCGNAVKQPSMCRATPASFQQVNSSTSLQAVYNSAVMPLGLCLKLLTLYRPVSSFMLLRLCSTRYGVLILSCIHCANVSEKQEHLATTTQRVVNLINVMTI